MTANYCLTLLCQVLGVDDSRRTQKHTRLVFQGGQVFITPVMQDHYSCVFKRPSLFLSRLLPRDEKKYTAHSSTYLLHLALLREAPAAEQDDCVHEGRGCLGQHALDPLEVALEELPRQVLPQLARRRHANRPCGCVCACVCGGGGIRVSCWFQFKPFEVVRRCCIRCRCQTAARDTRGWVIGRRRQKREEGGGRKACFKRRRERTKTRHPDIRECTRNCSVRKGSRGCAYTANHMISRSAYLISPRAYTTTHVRHGLRQTTARKNKKE